jgi:uncharacterized membrane protein YeiB
MVFAHLWLRRFRSGPMEWLWRAIAYRARGRGHARSDEARVNTAA